MFSAQRFLLLVSAFSVLMSACRNRPPAASEFLESMAIDAFACEFIFEAKVREAYPAEMTKEEERCGRALNSNKDSYPPPQPGSSEMLFVYAPIMIFLEVGIDYHNTEAQIMSIATEIAGILHGRVLGFRKAPLESDRALIEMHWKTKNARSPDGGSPAHWSTVIGVGSLWLASGLDLPWQFAREQPGLDAIGLLAARTALIGTGKCSGIAILIRRDILLEYKASWYIALTSRHRSVLEVRRTERPYGYVDEREGKWFGDEE